MKRRRSRRRRSLVTPEAEVAGTAATTAPVQAEGGQERHAQSIADASHVVSGRLLGSRSLEERRRYIFLVVMHGGA